MSQSRIRRWFARGRSQTRLVLHSSNWDCVDRVRIPVSVGIPLYTTGRQVKIHLPGRVAEITDPLLALIMASFLGLVDRT